jgi:hypothetical protein
MNIAVQPEASTNRAAVIRQAFRLEYVTLAWMTIEAAVAIGSGLAAGSLVLTAFGLDSLIELASADGGAPPLAQCSGALPISFGTFRGLD